jgi:hypothetical protein
VSPRGRFSRMPARRHNAMVWSHWAAAPPRLGRLPGRLVGAYAAGDWPEVLDLAEGLFRWLQSGGSPPKTQPGRKMDGDWNRAVSMAGCRVAIGKARKEGVR